MLRKTRRFPPGGFTLIEVMSAAAVLALALVGMIQVVVSGSEMLDVSKKQTIAMQIIHGQLEQIRLLSWDQVGQLGASDTRSVELGDDTSSGKMFLFGPNLPGIAQGFVCSTAPGGEGLVQRRVCERRCQVLLECLGLHGCLLANSRAEGKWKSEGGRRLPPISMRDA